MESREKIEKPIAAPGEGWADWFKSSAHFQEIRKGLVDRGFSTVDADKVMGGNFLRLWTDAFEPKV